MKTTTKVYLILYVVILHIFNSFGCVSSDSQNKIDPVLALLPWTLNNSSSIEIRVTNGCYNWKFDHEFIKTKSVVLRTDSFGNNCTDVLSVNPTWSHMDWRGVFTIIASDIYTGENLRSEIHVAKVERIITSTSSKRIRLGSLENLFAVGFDNEFNTFTSLSGLTIEWELENDNIESDNTFGSQILIAGSKVGSVNVHAKIVEEGYSLVSPPVTIYVEDPFRITPRIRRAPFGSLYQIHLTKDGTIGNENCFSKEHHLCEVDKSNEAEAQIIEGNKLILGKYNNQYNDTEIMISVTCYDRRVDGSFSNGFVYVSLPTGILFAIQDRVSLADSRKHINIDEFPQSYFVEGEHLIEKSGIFRILKDSELTIVQNTTAFLQIKLFNSNGEFLHVPINSEFDIVCKIGCSLVKINSSKNEYIKDGETNNGFLEITGNLIGQSEVIVKLNSIGGMDYSKSIPHVKLSEIISTLKINVVRNVSTAFSKLPLILYPGGQEINIKSSIEGGKGPFYFCSSDPLIAIVDFYTGLLKTNNMIGVVNILVYDIGTINFTDNKHTFSCETLKDTNSLKIPVCIAYTNDFYLQPLSLSSRLYNNTIYTSISQNLLSIEIKATPDKNFTGFSLEGKDKKLLSSMPYTKLDTLDILKLFDPCKIIEITNIYEFLPSIQYLHTYDTKECILILENLNAVSYRQISQDYNTDMIKFDIFEQQISIELKKHGYLNFERFMEFGIEFVYKSNVVRRSVLSIGLSINILQEISFTPLLNGIVSSYLEAYNTPKNICIEKSSKVALQLGGGLIENQDYMRLSIEYHKFKLILLEDNKKVEFKGTLEEIDNHKSIQVIQDEKNRFILQCNGDVAIGSFKFSMAIFDERSSELYRMESILKVSCLEISHINMFWVNMFPLVGKYACNTRNDNCLVYHFNSRVRHRFITLAYDIDNNLLLSYNSFATKWEIQHANDYSIDVEENNELTDGNVIELFVNLGSEYSMKDVNIIFEAHSTNSKENSSVQFRITTKGIFTIPPTLISPNMLNMHSHFNEYHRMEEEENGVNFAGSWNLIKGQHQFGIIYGTSNFNVFIDDGSNIKYGLCDQKKQKESVFSIENGFHNQNDKLNIFPFCLDSMMFSGNDNMAQKLNIYIEDQLILPKYVLKKELVFSSLSRLELIWLDRIGSNETIQGNSLSWETYFTYNNYSDPSCDSLYRLKIPKQYISFIRAGLSSNYFEKNQNMGNTLPCINGYYCLADNKSKSSLIVIVYNEEGAALEPWQETELKFEIEHKIIASYEPVLEIDENVEGSLSNFPVEINYRGLNTFQIVEVKEKNVDIEFIAKVLGHDLDSPIYSNALVLYVYESIELESDSDVFSLFPNGPPLQIGYKGGPRMLEYLKLEWDVQLERLPHSKSSNDDVLIIRDKRKMVIEPLGVVGSERVSIKCFITEMRYPNNFKTLIFSRLIDVYVDVPDRIDIFSPGQEYLYLGYPKVYRIRAWKSVDPMIPNFHYSQYFPSKVSQCSVTWSINQHIDMANYNGEVAKNFVCNPQSDLVCISNFFSIEHNNKWINDPALIEHNMYSQIYLHGYTVLLHPMKVGASNLKVRLHCNFGYKTDIELEHTQKLNIFSAIHSIENGIWINKDSFYYFSFPKQVIINSNSKLDIKHSNSSQTIYLNTWNSSKSIVIFNDEGRFEVESGILTTVSPIIISEPKTTFMEFDLIDEYSIKLSLKFFNSMGIMLFPNQNYCNGLKLYLIPVSNVIQEFVIIKGGSGSSSKSKLTDNLLFEESNLIKNCQFVLKQNSESSSSGLLGIINSWKIIDSSNQLNINQHDSCYMIQVYSSKNILVGSQPLCVEFNHSKSREVYEYGHNVYDLGLQSTGSLATRSIFHEFEVFSGSFLHLNPIKWRVLNSYPKNLNFCVVVDGSLNDLESLFIEELSSISNVPLSLINIAHNLLIELKSSSYFNIPSSNKQLVCVTINREIDPFEFWMALMKYSSIICKSYGVFWGDMDSDDAKNYFKDKNLESRNITPIWELLSHKSSAKIIENQILVIPSVSSNEQILLRLSNGVEINLKVIPVNDHIHKSRDIILNKKHELLKVNDQFSFSIYLNENNDPVNKYFNNIYYSSPFLHVHCNVSDPILREIYTATPYWSLGIPDGQFLLPSCNLVPRDGAISEELLSKIVNNYKSSFMYVSSKATKISFNIEIKLSSSEKIWRSVPVHFYPILIKPLSSSIFSSELTFKHNWINNTNQIKMTVPFSSVHDYRLPIRAIFWFGSLDTKLIAYSIENSTSNEYIVRYTPYNLKGEISISKNLNAMDSNDSYFSLTLPLRILLVLESSELKYHIDIFFERGGASNLLDTDGDAASKRSNFSEFSRLGIHTYIACISLAAAYILHFLLNRRQISTKEINSSPFRKINTQKW